MSEKSPGRRIEAFQTTHNPEHEPQPIGAIKFGWYSKQADTEQGHYHYRSPKGSIVVVTFVSDHPPPLHVKPGDQYNPESYIWDDTIYMGEVSQYVSFSRFDREVTSGNPE